MVCWFNTLRSAVATGFGEELSRFWVELNYIERTTCACAVAVIAIWVCTMYEIDTTIIATILTTRFHVNTATGQGASL